MSVKIPRSTEQWFKALLAAFITGASSSALSAVGIATANGMGIKVPQLDFHQLGIMLLSGGIVGALAYLAKSPVPPDSVTTIKESEVGTDGSSATRLTTITTPVDPAQPKAQ